jgi:predicted NBD/HSP70 family sugar kinase
MDFSGKDLAHYTIEIDNGTDTDTQIKLCYCIVDRLLLRSGLSVSDISEIGIAFPGFYDTKKDIFGLSENFPTWKNVHPKKVFEKKYGIPVRIDDCTRLMALAELWYGGVNSRDFLVFDLGYGIGCAIILNGKMYTGSGRKAGEIGHTVVEVGGPKCTCGKNGCIESLASGWALAAQAAEVLEGDAVLKSLCRDKKRIRVEDILLAAQMGSERCRALLESAGRYLAVGISNAMTLINPEKIIIGGGMINDNSILWDSIIKHVKLSAIPEIFNDTVIERSKLGEYASAIGAAACCLQPFFE